jgi:hypothetical protein
MDTGNIVGENVSLFAVEAFYYVAVGENGGAITAYATNQIND